MEYLFLKGNAKFNSGNQFGMEFNQKFSPDHLGARQKKSAFLKRGEAGLGGGFKENVNVLISSDMSIHRRWAGVSVDAVDLKCLDSVLAHRVVLVGADRFYNAAKLVRVQILEQKNKYDKSFESNPSSIVGVVDLTGRDVLPAFPSRELAEMTNFDGDKIGELRQSIFGLLQTIYSQNVLHNIFSGYKIAESGEGLVENFKKSVLFRVPVRVSQYSLNEFFDKLYIELLRSGLVASKWSLSASSDGTIFVDPVGSQKSSSVKLPKKISFRPKVKNISKTFFQA